MTPLSIGIVVAISLLIAFYAYYVWLLAAHPMPSPAGEVHVVKTADGWTLLLYRVRQSNSRGEPVFFCHSLFSNHLNFNVPQGESIVDELAKAGYDCWCVDLRGCKSARPAYGQSRRGVSVDDYLMKDIPAVLEYIHTATGYDKVHWVGHSFGGLLLYAFNIKFGSETLASAVTLGTPPGFKNIDYTTPRVVLAVNRIIPSLVSGTLRFFAPLSSRLKPSLPGMPVNWSNVNPKVGTTELLHMVEPVPPQVAATFDRWSNGGAWNMCGDTLKVGERLDEVTVPLLSLYGGGDPFTPIGDGELLQKRLGSTDKKMITLSRKTNYSEDYGHLDLVMAKNLRSEVCPPITDWLKAHPSAQTRPSRLTEAEVVVAPIRKRAARPKAVAAKDAVVPAEAKPAPRKKPAAKAEAKPAKPAPKKAAAKKAPAKKTAAKPKATAKKKPAAKRKPNA